MASNNALCILDNGQVRPYHAATPTADDPVMNPQVFDYMGTGVVYSVSGIMQPGNTRLRFYHLKTNRPRYAR